MAGIYVHVPFCHAKCAYCDFYSRPGSAAPLADAYIDALACEFEERRVELGRHDVRTIYFGGGTPSILTPEQFRRLAAVFREYSPEEFTVEANPEDIDGKRMKAWSECGVNRISMGVQSLADEELLAVGRRHTAAQAIDACRRLRRFGFSNISCDLIYGLPGQSGESWRRSVDTMLYLRPEHLSAYCLTIEPHTLLGVKLQRGDITETDDDTIAGFYDYLCRASADAGYSHYEISNFALPGYHSRHNTSYWDSTPYLGLGPGAHSLGADGIRRYVDSSLKRYSANPAECLHFDTETETEKVNDIIFTALRTSQGLDITKIPAKYQPEFKAKADAKTATGELLDTGTHLHIPESRWLISDATIRDLLL